jgi:hypothetical protein
MEKIEADARGRKIIEEDRLLEIAKTHPFRWLYPLVHPLLLLAVILGVAFHLSTSLLVILIAIDLGGLIFAEAQLANRRLDALSELVSRLSQKERTSIAGTTR